MLYNKLIKKSLNLSLFGYIKFLTSPLQLGTNKLDVNRRRFSPELFCQGIFCLSDFQCLLAIGLVVLPFGPVLFPKIDSIDDKLNKVRTLITCWRIASHSPPSPSYPGVFRLCRAISYPFSAGKIRKKYTSSTLYRFSHMSRKTYSTFFLSAL